jgi:hypothetical protein
MVSAPLAARMVLPVQLLQAVAGDVRAKVAGADTLASLSPRVHAGAR